VTREGPAPKTDKRERILDAALSEFVERGYDGTSTALIAERAGVAKALVFHYFSSKDALFLAVVDEVTTRAQAEFAHVMATAPPDVLARILAWTERKLSLFREDPSLIRFFLFVLPSAPASIRDEVRARNRKLAVEYTPLMIEGADASRLRVTPQEALRALETLALGFEQRLYALPAKGRSAAQIEKLIHEARKVFALVAKALYRERPDDA
jgi:TetR/AcrR family transcriptional regulator